MSTKLVLCFFFFNDTATTEIYSYVHTLTLLDALPISRRRDSRPRLWQPLAGPHPPPDRLYGKAGRDRRPRRFRRAALDRDSRAGAEHRGGVKRSEEHTSELQSLMRISYAVFCLKKKKRKSRDEIDHATSTTKHR